MNPLVLAWVLSITAAAAFLWAGYLFGRHRTRLAALGSGSASTPMTPALASVAEPPPPRPPMPPSAPAPASPPPRTVRSKTVDPSYLEGRLAQALRRLDPERELAQLVLCDEFGLPLAAAETAAGPSHDPEVLSALAAEALGLMNRVGDALDKSHGVAVQIATGRVLQIRPVLGAEVPVFLVSLGAHSVPDDRFATFSSEVARLIRSSPQT